MTTKTRRIWDAEGYHKYSQVQSTAAFELLEHVPLKGTEQILDVGCGDGKLTAHLARCVPQGSVLGIDSSEEMITFAREKFPKNEYPNLSFSLHKAQEINSVNAFDLVFSSFALQWVLDIDACLERIFRSLRHGGRFVAVAPKGLAAFGQGVRDTMAQKKWAPYFLDFVETSVLRDEHEFSRLLSKYQFQTNMLNNVLQNERFSSKEQLEKWFRYPSPHLCYLPEHLRVEFVFEVIDRYLEDEPPFEDGSIPFAFSRVDIIATKPAL